MKQAGSTLLCGSRAFQGLFQLQRSSKRVRDPNLTWGLPIIEFQCWEEELLRNLGVKISENSNRPGEIEGNWKPRCPLKWLMKTCLLLGTHPGVQWRYSDWRSRCYRNIQKERESCVYRTATRMTATIISALIPPPVKPVGGYHIACDEVFLRMAKS